ncbi:MAG: hypothetical protein JSS09_07205, partial [Verrucomicrobia bacterium]|nr:hypothetical protein [Verrucomicrobiota bacterium]
MKWFIFISCFLINSLLSSVISLDEISERPVFKSISFSNPIGSAELCEIITPVLKEHIIQTNGDRLSILNEYLLHHDKLSSENKNISPLETLATFSPSFSLSEFHGSYCFTMNEDLASRLPSHIHCYTIPATLFPISQQPFWPILSHVALIIPFHNPIDPKDAGYILLDPHLKMDTPLVALLSGDPKQKDLKEKGTCTFFYYDNKILSKSNLSINGLDYSMTYYIKEITNSVKANLRPILAADRKSLLFSRSEDGKIMAYISLLFDDQVIRYYINDKEKKEI